MSAPQEVTDRNIRQIPIPCWGLVEYWGGAKPGKYWQRYKHVGELIRDYYYTEDSCVSKWLPDQKETPELP